jgi:hypothetical protein
MARLRDLYQKREAFSFLEHVGVARLRDDFVALEASQPLAYGEKGAR